MSFCANSDQNTQVLGKCGKDEALSNRFQDGKGRHFLFVTLFQHFLALFYRL